MYFCVDPVPDGHKFWCTKFVGLGSLCLYKSPSYSDSLVMIGVIIVG